VSTPVSATRARDLHVVLAIARADFLERVRRHGFLVTLLFAAWGARGALPPRGAHYSTVSLDGHRALYDSAGTGTIVAVITGLFLSLIGFYLVKNSVERDRHTGVGQILAGTRMGRFTYVAGKVTSDFAVLAAMVVVMTVVAAVMQQVLGEDRRVDLIALVSPFVLITLPTLFVVSAVAVLFEVIPGLRGGLGNVVFFFGWVFGIAAGMPDSVVRLPIGDVTGMAIVMPALEQSCARTFPDYVPGTHTSAGINFGSGAATVTRFAFRGVRWTPGNVARRLAWVGIALVITLTAAARFDRFDAAPSPTRRRRRRGPRADGEEAEGGTTPASEPGAAPAASVTALRPVLRGERLAPLVRAELAVMFQGVNRWWYAAALLLAALVLTLPIAGVRMVVLPVAVLWPLLLWSSIGWRERRHGVDALLSSSPRPVRRQVLATWLAGVALTLAATGAYGLRSALGGDSGALLGWLAGMVFIPSFALASGVWTGSGKLFEVVFLALWYVGPLQRLPALDFLGTSPEARAPHLAFLAVGTALLALAYLGRALRLRR
jgi:hypothetical protein